MPAVGDRITPPSFASPPRLRSRILAVAGTLIAVAVGLGLGVRGVFLFRQHERDQNNWAEARACLFGPAIEQDESVRERVARLQWAPPNHPPTARRRFGEPVPLTWPEHCRPQVEQLATQTKSPELEEVATRLGAHLRAIEDAKATPRNERVALDLGLLEAMVEVGASLEPLPSPKEATVMPLAPRALVGAPMLASLFPRLEGIASVYLDARDQQPFDNVDMLALATGTCTFAALQGKPVASLRCGDRRAVVRVADEHAVPDPPLDPEGRSPLKVRTCRGPHRSVVVYSREFDWNRSGSYGSRTLGGHTVRIEEERGFSEPITIAAHATETGPRARVSYGSPTLACSDGEARIATASSSWDADQVDAHHAYRWTCREGKCVEEHVSLGHLNVPIYFLGMNTTDSPDGVEAPLVVDLGPKTLVLWRSFGAVWARLAPFAELGSAPNIVLAGNDDRFELSWGNDTLLTRDHAVLVFLTVRDGTKEAVLPIRADADGDVRAVLP